MEAMAPDGSKSGAQERQPPESEPNACHEEREPRQPFDRSAFPFGYLARSADEHGAVDDRTQDQQPDRTRSRREGIEFRAQLSG